MNTTKIISFGVGCFHFGVNREPPFSISMEQYIQELQNVLEQIPNINNIKITIHDLFKDLVLKREDKYENIEEGYSFLPNSGTSLRIKFEIYIPYPIQIDLRQDFAHEGGPERFEVDVRYDSYYFPIAYVQPLDAGIDTHPSDSVIIVREFLKSQFKQFKNQNIRFECLGPSPFHANFFLVENGNDESVQLTHNLSYKITRRTGYDKFEFYCDDLQTQSMDDLKQSLYEELKYEFAVYYAIQHSDVVRMSKWSLLQEQIYDLIEMHKKKGFLKLVSRFFGFWKDYNTVFITLAEFEAHDMMCDYMNYKNYSKISEARTPVLKEYVEHLRDAEYFKFPNSQLKELIQLFEAQRNKNIESFIVIVSALLGGAVGSLITILSTSK